jgi:nitrate/nitrite-specific signal transduction histidine kinase
VILALIGLVLGIVIAVVIVALLTAVVRPLREIRQYAEAILESGIRTARNLDGIEEMGRTDRLASGLAARPRGHLERLRGPRP